MDERIRAAAVENATWCDLVCRAYGVATSFTDDFWVASGTTPPFYPSVVTLRSAARAEAILAHLADRRDVAVKDSFATLDLGGFGFTVLFGASWIYRRPGAAADSAIGWRLIDSPDSLARWHAAAVDVTALPAVVLDDPDVRVVALSEGTDTVAGGAILNRSDSVVGVSNVFSATSGDDRLWPSVVAAATDLFPGLPLVGYEHGPSLEPVLGAGFTELGPLRIWVRTS